MAHTANLPLSRTEETFEVRPGLTVVHDHWQIQLDCQIKLPRKGGELVLALEIPTDFGRDLLRGRQCGSDDPCGRCVHVAEGRGVGRAHGGPGGPQGRCGGG